MNATLLGLLLLLAPAGDAAAEPAEASLRSFHLYSSLGRIAHHDPLGLGDQAARARDWAAGRARLVLIEPQERPAYLTDGEEELAIGSELADALVRLQAYLEAAAEAQRSPVATAQLAEAALAPAGVERIRDLFDRAIAEAIVLDGELVAPELGGEATIPLRAPLAPGVAEARPAPRQGLQLREFRDPTREALQAVARHRDDPSALAALFERADEGLALLDSSGQLEREVALYQQRTQRGVPLERRRRPLAMAVETILRNGSDSFTLHPRDQLEAILEHGGGSAWGRLVGLWHLHPPGWSQTAWLAAAPPSPDDRQVARTTGQFLTIVFHPEGFDLHDLQTRPLGPAPPGDESRVIRYRSEQWRAHFAESWARARERVEREALTTSP